MTTDDPRPPDDGDPRRGGPCTSASPRARSPSRSIVRLNVGGVRYESTLRTLVDSDPHSMLARLLTGDVPPARDASGAVFLDRDGGLFGHVLAFLRDGARAPLPLDDTHALRALAVEADYFQLDGLAAAVADALPSASESGAGPDAATARARAAAAGPDGVLDAALCADGGRLLASLELLVGLAYSAAGPGAPGSAPAVDVEAAVRGRGVCHQRRPGCFDAFVEEGDARGPAGALTFSRELEPAFDAPLLFGGGYDKALYAPPSGRWPPDLADRNLTVFQALAAAPLDDPDHAALKEAILSVAGRPSLAALLLRRRFGFGDGSFVRGSRTPVVTWRPSCTYGTSDVFTVTVASVRLTLKF